jgi:hypothetical protein
MSSLPNRSTAARTIASTWASSVTSQAMGRTVCPCDASSPATCCTTSAFRSASTVAALLSAKARAVARPIPELAPVTSATVLPKS